VSILASQLRAVCSIPASLAATSGRAFDAGVPAKIATVFASSVARSSVVSAPARCGVTMVSRPAADISDSIRRRVSSTMDSLSVGRSLRLAAKQT
jgi:hypothetical protein